VASSQLLNYDILVDSVGCLSARQRTLWIIRSPRFQFPFITIFTRIISVSTACSKTVVDCMFHCSTNCFVAKCVILPPPTLRVYNFTAG